MVYQIVLAVVSISGANVTGITQMMGAAEADADTLNGKTRLEMLKTIYPVGCIYMTASSENPSKTFGFGTWEQWGAGRVPVGINTQDADFNAAEKTGGAKTSSTPSGGAGTSGGTSLTAAQLAAHTHTGPSHTHTGPSHAHTAPGHTHSGPNHWHQLNLTRGNYNTFSIAWGSGVASLANIVKFQTNKGDPVIAAAHTAGTAMTTNQLFVDQLNNCNVTANSGTGATGSAGAAATTASGTGATGAAGTGATGSTGSGTAHTHSTPAHTHGAQSIVQPYVTCYMWKRTA